MGGAVLPVRSERDGRRLRRGPGPPHPRGDGAAAPRLPADLGRATCGRSRPRCPRSSWPTWPGSTRPRSARTSRSSAPSAPGAPGTTRRSSWPRSTARSALDQDWPVAIVGIGNLGRALANSEGFSSRGFRVACCFDVRPGRRRPPGRRRRRAARGRARRALRRPRPAIGVVATPAVGRPGGRRRLGRHRGPLDPEFRLRGCSRFPPRCICATSTSRSSSRS